MTFYKGQRPVDRVIIGWIKNSPICSVSGMKKTTRKLGMEISDEKPIYMRTSRNPTKG